ncbi:MAG: hypothetical protein AABY86_03900 [Bdellovibrionota bacterium]
MALNIRAYQPLDHPPVTFPERYAKNEASADALGTARRDEGERAKFLEDWQRMLDGHLHKQNKQEEEDSEEMGLTFMRELDAI